MSVSLDGVLVKKGNQQETFTREQLEDFAACAHPKTGPFYFLNQTILIFSTQLKVNYYIKPMIIR